MYKKNLFKHAQAMIELAILGPLLLTTFGIILTYVVKLNKDQWELMSAFRHALAKAHDTNKIISYATYNDNYGASINKPIIGQRVPSSGSGNVHWAIKDVTEGSQDNTAEPESYIKINGGAIPKLYEYKLTGGGDVEPIYLISEKSQVTVNSHNKNTTTGRSAGLAEVMIYKVDKQVFVQGRAHGGSRRYSTSN